MLTMKQVYWLSDQALGNYSLWPRFSVVVSCNGVQAQSFYRGHSVVGGEGIMIYFPTDPAVTTYFAQIKKPTTQESPWWSICHTPTHFVQDHTKINIFSDRSQVIILLLLAGHQHCLKILLEVSHNYVSSMTIKWCSLCIRHLLANSKIISYN